MGLYDGFITELYYGIILRNYITGLHHGIIFQNHITETYFRSHIKGLCHRIILWNHPYEKNPWQPRADPGAPWDLWGRRGHASGTPRDAPCDPQACPQDTMGKRLGSPGTPGDPHGPHNWQISTNVQRKKLLIVASESVCCDPSPQRLPGPFCVAY